jgi:hypothetical protein
MWVRVHESCFGFGRFFAERELVELGDAQALELIGAGVARRAEAPPPPAPEPQRETATAAPATETAAPRATRARRVRAADPSLNSYPSTLNSE